MSQNKMTLSESSRGGLTSIRSRLASKFLSIFIPLLALFCLGIFILVPYFYKNHGLRSMGNKAKNIANIAAYSVAPAVFFDDLPTINEVVLSLSQDEDLVAAIIKNEKGEDLAVFKRSNALDLKAIINLKKGISADKKTLVEALTVKYQDKELGRIILGFSLESLHKETRRVQRIAGLASFILFLVCLSIVYYLSQIVTRALRQITEAASEIAAGNYLRRVEITSSDEVGLLAIAFNKMLDRLAETMNHLEEARANLEKRVEQRTAELQREVAERKQAEERLKESEDLFRSMVESLGEGVVIADENEFFLFANQAARRIFETEERPLVGHSLREFTTPEQFVLILEQTKERRAGKKGTYELRISLPDGREKVLLVTATPRFDADNKFTSSLAVLTDITEIKETEATLRKIKSQLEETVEQLEKRNEEANLFLEMGDSLQLAQNEAEIIAIAMNYARRLFPQESGALYLKKKEGLPLEKKGSWGEIQFKVEDFFPEECWALRKGQMHSVEGQEKNLLCPHLLREEKLPGPSLCLPLISFYESLGVLVMSCCREKMAEKRKVGLEYRTLRLSLALNFTQRLGAALSTIRLRESLREQSIHDPLTGLFNRRFLEETLEREIHRAQRSGAMVVVIMLDLDHFKQFNDSYGHDAGDTVLQAMAQFLRKSVRREDMVCRYGGEEFTIIMPVKAFEIARTRAEVILDGVRHLEISYQGNVFRNLSVSIGLSSFPEDGDTAETLLQAADQALLEAKRTGRNQLVLAKEIRAK